MADERIKIILDAGMDISDVQANAKQIQNILKSFKMPAALSEDFEKQFKTLETEITKIQAQMKAGFKTKGDITGLEKSTKMINTVFGTLKNLYNTFENEHLMMNVDFDTDEIKQAKKDLADLQQQLKSKINTTEFTNLGEKIKEIGTLSKSSAVKNLKESFSSLDLSSVRSDLDSVVGGLTNFAKGNKDAVAAAKLFQDAWSSGKLDDIDSILTEMTPNMQKVALAARDARKDLDALGNSDIGKLSNEIQKTTQHVKELSDIRVNDKIQDFKEVGNAIDTISNKAEQCGDSIKGAAHDMYSFSGQVEQIKNRVKDFFSLTNSVMLFRRGVQKAFEAVKELDAAMTETAVVTDFSVGDMWDQLPRYTQAANELGTTTLGAYETMTLFYQQGLKTNEAFEIGTETMKMARIAGLDYANATDLMTAALRGFNMELNETSAARINDVYSELAAITAADTSEIANAMTKTASIAANANMEFETTAALLSQIIETTREPAETAGTAMKTIIARFTEMKKSASDIINVDGEEVNVNKVEAALRDAGVALRDVNGEFRDLDDVFLELSSKWNSLDKMTQRYVATMAAGSRQQSRFIAMMQDYDRTMELVDAAYSSSGASQKQFEKTQDSLESKINKLKNAWNEFLMGISNSKVIKAGVDALTELLNIINKLTGNSGLLKLGVAIGAFAGGSKIFNGLLKTFTPLKSLMNKEGEESAVSFLSGMAQRIANFKSGKAFVIDADINTKGINNKIAKTKKSFSELGNAISPAGGSWSKGFKTLFETLAPILKVLAPISAILGVIAATLYVIYNLSPYKKAKTEAENAAGAVEDYNNALEKNKEELSSIDNLLSELKGRDEVFDDLIVGSNEWYEAIVKSNQALLEQINLLSQLGYEIDYSYDENGLIQIDNKNQLQQAQTDLLKQQIELQKGQSAATYQSEVASLKSKFITENSDKQIEAFKEEFGENIAKAAIAAGATETVGQSAAAISEMVPGAGLLIGPIISAVTHTISAIELAGGAIIGFVEGLEEGTEEIQEFSKEGVYAELTRDQKEELDLISQKNALATWNLYNEDQTLRKAGQVVISNIDDAYKEFYSNDAFQNQFKGYRIDDYFGNFELVKYDSSTKISVDLKEENLDNIIKDLGYKDWNEAATQLGLKWDADIGGAEGLYKLDKDGNKQYFDISDHGIVDTEEQWKSLLSDSKSGIHLGDSKDIDTGFLALKLAEGKRGKRVVDYLSNTITNEMANQILYGTEDWVNKSTDNIEDPIEIAAYEAINEANSRKQRILNDIYKTSIGDDKPFERLERETIQDFASDIQKLEVDTNTETALAYQAFVTSKIAKQAELADDVFSEQAQDSYDIFSKIDVTDPTKSLQILNEEIERGSNLAKEAKEVKENFSTEGGFLDLSNQFADLLSSGTLDEIGEEISKISDEAGNIDVTATRELVDSNTELKNIMDEFNVSGYAMGKILSDIQKGEITLTDINNGLIESYKLLYSAMNQAEDVLYDLRNADLGEDYTEIGRTYEERYNTIKDLYERGAYGSESFAGNIKSLIGEEEWKKYLITYQNNTKEAWEQISKDYALSKNDGNLYGSLSSLIARGATDSKGRQAFKNANGIITYDFSDFESYDDILEHMVNAFSVSREYAKAMLADMATYSETLQNDLNALNAATNANNVYDNMIHMQVDGKHIAYTELSDIQITEAFSGTEEWNSVLKEVNGELDKAIKKFKEIYKIQNKLSVNDKEYAIESVDSAGNLYYRDESKKLRLYNSLDTQNKRKKTQRLKPPRASIENINQQLGVSSPELRTENETDEQYGKRLSEDKNVIQAAIQLDSEQFDAWLNSYTGEENAVEILGKVEVTQESLAGMDKIRSEMEAKIASVVQTLKDIEITIPVTIPTELAQVMLGDKYQAGKETLEIKIGGEKTSVKPVGGSSGDGNAWLRKVAETYNNFHPLTSGNGSVYPYGGDPTNGENGGGGDKSDFEKESDRIKSKMDELDSAIEDLADNDIVDMQMVNQLIQQKIALQKDYKKALERELEIISATTDDIWKDVKKAGNDKYIEYDDETGSYRYTDAYYEDFFKDGVSINSEQMQKVQDQASQLNRLNSDQLANQIAIKELVDNLVENQTENYNAERQLKGRERRQEEADREEQLIGMLPEEIQPFFMALNTAEDTYLEYQEIQANKVLAENKKQELDASYASVPDYIKDYMTFDEYSGYGIDLAKINQIEDKEAREEMMTAVKGNAEVLNTLYDDYYEIHQELSGGKFQKAIIGAGKALTNFSKELKDGKIDDGLLKVSTGFEALDDALNGFIDKLEDDKFLEKILNTKITPDLHLTDEQLGKIINNDEFMSALSKSGWGQFVLNAASGGGTVKDFLSGLTGSMGGMLEGIGGLMNFDMMEILGGAGGLMEQGKQMAEQVIGYITQATQAIIDAWTNREDYLYNFLQILERYLHEYEVMQRYSTQLEKGRVATVDDIRQNWENQWKSLQDQLEMQEERIETRQQQLNLSRFNPFMFISGWDPTSDALYENREIKMAFDLLVSAIGMLPMGLGAFGGQLNQLYEDYDKRVQDAYQDRLEAEMAIIDIEDERLELVKIGADEATEFEQKVLNALIAKEQEQIDELSRLNDAVTDANSKLISTLQSNLDKLREDRENEKKEEELSEKQRRLSYLRQDTSGANMLEIKKLEEQLEEEHEDYTDTLIDQKISELEEQNEKAAEQRQQQIELLQAQLDWSEKYGLYWDAVYGMLYTIDENGKAILNPENFDLDGNIRENSQLAKMLGTFSDQIGMSVWSQVLDNEENKRLGRYYGAFIGNNGVTGEWADYWALLNPRADDPDYATQKPEVPEGIWGILYELETTLTKYFGSSNTGLWNMGERFTVGIQNVLGKAFNIEEWANATAESFAREDVVGNITLAAKDSWDNLTNNFLDMLSFGNKTGQSLTVNNTGIKSDSNEGVTNKFDIFIDTFIGEDSYAATLADRISSMFTTGIPGLQSGNY